MKRSKLSIKLLWYVTPLVIVPLLFLGGFALMNVTKSTEQQAEIIVSRFVQQQQQKIFNYTSVYHSTTELLSNSPVLSDFLNTPSENTSTKTEKLGSLLDVFASYTNAYPDILSIELIDPSNQTIAFYSSDLFTTPKPYTFLNKLNQSKKEKMLFMEQNKTNVTSMYFVRPIYKSHFHLESKVLQAYLVLHLSPSVVKSSILESPFENTLNLMIDTEGKILFSSDPVKHGIYLTEYELNQIKHASNNANLAELRINSIDDHLRMIYVIEMPQGDYFISSIPKDVLYKAGKEISLITALIVLISIVILPILIFVVVRTFLLTPLEQLTHASRSVGDGNLKVHLPAFRKDEMGDLFHDFNHMVSQIRHYQGQLEDYKEHLEEKVQARTHALAKMNHQLEHAIEQAELANKLKSRFLANMSHEIRTPLTAIMGFTEQMLVKKMSLDSETHLKTVLRNSKHLLELINNILDLSKIEAEKIEVEQHELDIHHLIEDVKSVILVQAQDKKLAFKIDYHYPLPSTIKSDITRLKQILLNVCTNAIKFTASGHVSLAVKYLAEIEKLKFVVTDTGIGMDQDAVSRIFKPFEQADSSTTRNFGGTGLGLCISKNLAQLLGGNIEVSSEEGIGSCFTITISTNNANQPVKLLSNINDLSLIQQEKMQIKSSHYDAKILVAEDNMDNQELIKLLLEHWGLNPEFANNGQEAVEMALMNDYDLILMDMQMPIMGGQEATQMLRHTAYDGPIIALTANVMKQDVAIYLEAGCDQTLAKPIDKQALEHTLEKYLSLQKITNDKWDEILNSKQFTQLNEDYQKKLPTLLTQLQQPYETQDWQKLKEVAHSIKGSSGCFGFMDIYGYANELELVLDQQEYNKISSLYEKLINCIERESVN